MAPRAWKRPVILADATADPAKLGRRNPPLDLAGRRRRERPVIRPKKEERCRRSTRSPQTSRRATCEEHWRLLYVAHDPRQPSGW